MGSLAFVALARTAWMIVNDSENPNGRLLLPIKNNISADTSGLAYTIESTLAAAPTIHWSKDAVKLPADARFAGACSIGRPDDERQRAIQWLQNYLSSGPKPTTEIKRAAEAHGFSYGTLLRLPRSRLPRHPRRLELPLALETTRPDMRKSPRRSFAHLGISMTQSRVFSFPPNPFLPPLTPDTRHPTPNSPCPPASPVSSRSCPPSPSSCRPPARAAVSRQDDHTRSRSRISTVGPSGSIRPKSSLNRTDVKQVIAVVAPEDREHFDMKFSANVVILGVEVIGRRRIAGRLRPECARSGEARHRLRRHPRCGPALHRR